MASSEKKTSSKVVIIGAGFSGLTMACQLQRKLNCDDYVIYDRSPRPGGAWWANQYPGCAVDIPAVFYSLSFAPNPDFTQIYPPQAEILEYFNRVADRFDVSRHITPNTEWEGAYWQDVTNNWLVQLRNLSTGQIFHHHCKILISAVGGLVNPNQFNVPGTEVFEGDIVHTARWKPDMSLHQKNVVVVGNGCSAAQLVPAIADETRSITQFIRTPQFYLENDNMQVYESWKYIFRNVPGVLRFMRFIVFLYLESTGVRFRMNDKGDRARHLSTARSKEYIKSNAPEQYWPLLMPNYELGCKRRIFDNSKYIACLQRSDIHLTNDPIVKISSHSIFTKSGQEHPADAILLATGFSLTQYDVDLVGRNGRTRKEHWEHFGYKEAFNTVAMSEFPNFFYILGPNSGKSHTSTIYSIENYVDLVIKVIAPVIEDLSSFVEVRPEKEKLYNEKLHNKIAEMIFHTSCNSYFIDQKTQKNWFIYPWSSLAMWYSTHWCRADDWVYNVRPGKYQRSLSLVHAIMLFMIIIPFFSYWNMIFSKIS